MNDMEALNWLPTEVKVLVVNGQNLVEETRALTKEKRPDLTSKLQLRDDCAAVEKAIKKLKKGKLKEKDVENLRLAVIRLETTSYEILKRPEE